MFWFFVSKWPGLSQLDIAWINPKKLVSSFILSLYSFDCSIGIIPSYQAWNHYLKPQHKKIGNLRQIRLLSNRLWIFFHIYYFSKNFYFLQMLMRIDFFVLKACKQNKLWTVWRIFKCYLARCCQILYFFYFFISSHTIITYASNFR